MNVRDSVIECYKRVIEEESKDINIDENTVISRDNGIDSLGIVTLIFEIEEKLDIDLDEYLSGIRKSKTIGNLIEVISNAYNSQENSI